MKCEKSKKITLAEGVWYITLVLQMVESALDFSFSIFKITYICCMLLLAREVFINGRKNMTKICRDISGIIKTNIIFWGFLSCYIIFDIISFSYTQDISYALTKYIVAIMMIVFIGMYLVIWAVKQDDIKQMMNRVLFCVALSGLIISIISIVNYFVGLFPVIYERRLSTITDYNQFSTLIILGFTSGIWYITYLKWEKRIGSKMLFTVTLLYSIFELSVIYLAGSRRSFIIECASGVVIVGILIHVNIKFKAKKGKWIVGLIAGTLVGVFAFSACMNNMFDYVYNYGNSKKEFKENNINSSMKTIVSGEAGNKRNVIWKIAIDEFQRFSTKEKLIGKGSSYGSDLYDTPRNEEILMRTYASLKDKNIFRTHWMYPHNFLLTDLVTGGIVKLLLGLGIMISLIVYVLKGIRKNYQFWFAGILIGVPYFSILLSFPHGILAYKNFWIGVFIIVLLTNTKKDCLKEMEIKKVQGRKTNAI